MTTHAVMDFKTRTKPALFTVRNSFGRRFSALTLQLMSALTALALLALLFTASGHRHISASDDLACLVCTAVFKRATDLVTPMVLPTRPTALAYRVLVSPVHQAAYRTPALLPRNCGPPEQT